MIVVEGIHYSNNTGKSLGGGKGNEDGTEEKIPEPMELFHEKKN